MLAGLNDADMVIGYRLNRKETDGFIRFFSSKIANRIRNLVLRENFRDVGTFLRGYRRECISRLVLYSGFQVFCASLLNLQGFYVKEIPIKCFSRRHGESKYNIWNMMCEELIPLLVVKWMQKNKLRYKIVNNR